MKVVGKVKSCDRELSFDELEINYWYKILGPDYDNCICVCLQTDYKLEKTIGRHIILVFTLDGKEVKPIVGREYAVDKTYNNEALKFSKIQPMEIIVENK